MTLVRWHGHACFEIVSSRGTVIVIDPHDGHQLGIKPPKAQADIVLITHDHFDHNAYHIVAKPNATILKMFLGEKIVDDVRIKGVKSYHDTVKGRRRGENCIYRIEVDGISFVHLGDLGHELDESYAKELKPVDILLTPVGGTFTIDEKGALSVVKLLEPDVVIPMHYWIPGLNLPLKPVDEFVKLAEAAGWKIERVNTNYIELDPKQLPKNVVFVLSPP